MTACAGGAAPMRYRVAGRRGARARRGDPVVHEYEFATRRAAEARAAWLWDMADMDRVRVWERLGDGSVRLIADIP